jgi:hypothetical protein
LQRYAVAAIAIVWTALFLRLILDVYWSISQGTGAFYGLLKFITAFTTLANILVGLALTTSLVNVKSPLFRVLSRPSVMGCAATYITVMAGVFILLLAPIAPSVGIQRVVGGFLHGINPAIYLAYWLLFAPKRRLRAAYVFVWPIGALAYFILILIRGAITGIYPYPFVDVGSLGYAQVMLNATILLGVFIAVGLSFVAVDRWAPWGAPATRDGQ